MAIKAEMNSTDLSLDDLASHILTQASCFRDVETSRVLKRPYCRTDGSYADVPLTESNLQGFEVDEKLLAGIHEFCALTLEQITPDFFRFKKFSDVVIVIAECFLALSDGNHTTALNRAALKLDRENEIFYLMKAIDKLATHSDLLALCCLKHTSDFSLIVSCSTNTIQRLVGRDFKFISQMPADRFAYQRKWALRLIVCLGKQLSYRDLNDAVEYFISIGYSATDRSSFQELKLLRDLANLLEETYTLVSSVQNTKYSSTYYNATRRNDRSEMPIDLISAIEDLIKSSNQNQFRGIYPSEAATITKYCQSSLEFEGKLRNVRHSKEEYRAERSRQTLQLREFSEFAIPIQVRQNMRDFVDKEVTVFWIKNSTELIRTQTYNSSLKSIAVSSLPRCYTQKYWCNADQVKLYYFTEGKHRLALHSVYLRKDFASVNLSFLKEKKTVPGLGVHGGFLYYIGGRKKFKELVADALRYNLSENSWEDINPLPIACGIKQLEVVPSTNRLYVISEYDVYIQELNLTTMQWKLLEFQSPQENIKWFSIGYRGSLCFITPGKDIFAVDPSKTPIDLQKVGEVRYQSTDLRQTWFINGLLIYRASSNDWNMFIERPFG